ncbi:hypothetical protein KAR91_27340 [Candidatus Pacearchaeota archaeon]|nr:hypothetical protein [Candidatus Pacearchaeota archaeon]
MSWIARVQSSIFPLSKEKNNIRIALSEWFYNGETYDLEEPIEDCQLCYHPNIRYQFTIVNRNTNESLLIGSECITKFDIRAVDERGNLLNLEQTGKKVKSDRNKLITEAQRKRVIASLVSLASLDEQFKIDSFINYYQERKAFTPNQLSLLVWRLERFDVPYKKSDFKTIIRRNREKDQLLEMNDFKLRQIWKCLSNSQKKFFIENNGYDPTN